MPQRPLVNVRGPTEALPEACGNAHTADVEYLGSPLSTPNSINIKAVRGQLNEGFQRVLLSTSTGDERSVLPRIWSTGVDVISVRGAACSTGAQDRIGNVTAESVADLFG